jgi:hypothetical protein
MFQKLKSKKTLLLIGIAFVGIFLPTIIGDVNNKLILIPVFIGLILVGFSINKD